MDTLAKKVWTQSLIFLLVTALLIFLPAWTLNYWQAWLYLLVFGASMMASGLYFLKHDPRLVERRMRVGAAAEKEPTQKIIQAFAGVLLIAMSVVAGLDHHFRWSDIPPTIVIIADVMIVVSFWIFFRTFKENSYAASTITVEQGQPVIATGPYAIVRHPMYSGAVVLFLAAPLALGSAWALIPGALVIAILVLRLLDEEKFLSVNLPGYVDYLSRVRFRLIPYVW